jgi:glutamate-1-semialdehyde 2,1-aminomutase
MRSYARSAEIYARAKKSLAGGVSSEFRKFNAPHPLVIADAKGSRVTDVDGNVYIDFSLSQGPAILGHSHPEVLTAVHEASQHGQIYAAAHVLEIELAELLQRVIPCAELVRLSLTGSEADHTALRIARGATGKQRFIRFEGHYHGWFDNVSYAVSGALDQLGAREQPTPVAWTGGLPDNVRDEFITLPWNDLALVEQTLAAHNDIAAVITDPIMCNSGCIEPAPGFLQGLRTLCTQHNVCLIFDEVITGFRVALGGAQAHYGITPDLAVFAKAMANGYPISAICGTERWMRVVSEGKVVHAGTLNGGVPSVAAALATLRIMERDKIHADLFEKGLKLKSGLRALADELGEPVLLQGPGPMFHMAFTKQLAARDYRDTLMFDKARQQRFTFEMQERGVRMLSRGLWYLSSAITDADISQALDAARDALISMRAA